ncbi:hypothetical protein ASD21_19970 [Caulobacter sp. Root1455]|uniref:hypothetical protein n=1 Tax=unclassified Caulobacter TaxID=2648921 RepID=UPI0006F267CC|nr:MULTISPECIES: hypothetical protein [unclassified Caulobacter]KQY26147.1 hypothetical protein ASD38_20605 [Caulobacter sp. Root487D2Y]KQZ04083.1 hypothetical protein ASD21_19970 [Caulobacter sp. Root1455]
MPTYNWNLNANVNIQTVVSSQGGSTNNVATVNIISAGQTLWSTTLIQTSNVGVVSGDLVIGTGASATTIFAGTNFTLTVPTSLLNGNMAANITYSAPNEPKHNYSGLIATWTLTSA